MKVIIIDENRDPVELEDVATEEQRVATLLWENHKALLFGLAVEAAHREIDAGRWAPLRFERGHLLGPETIAFIGYDDDGLPEHGHAVVIHRYEVIDVGQGDFLRLRWKAQPAPVEPPPPRPRPAIPLEAIRAMLQAGDWDGLDRTADYSANASSIDQVVLRHLLTVPADEALALLDRATRWLVGTEGATQSTPDPHGWAARDVSRTTARFIPTPTEQIVKDVDPRVLRRLLDVGRYRLDSDLLCDTTDSTVVRRLLELGTEVNPRGQRSPLAAHVNHEEIFEILLRAGADPSGLLDSRGELVLRLSPAQTALLRELHPKRSRPARVAANPPDPTDGAAFQIWLEQGWIELEPGADPTLVARALDRLLSMDPSSAKLLDRLCQVPGVGEIFASEAEVDRFLEDWG